MSLLPCFRLVSSFGWLARQGDERSGGRIHNSEQDNQFAKTILIAALLGL